MKMLVKIQAVATEILKDDKIYTTHLRVLLKRAANCFLSLHKIPDKEDIEPLFEAFNKRNLLDHKDIFVKQHCAVCFCQVLRIYAPEGPLIFCIADYKKYFELILVSFDGLNDTKNDLDIEFSVLMLGILSKKSIWRTMIGFGFFDLLKDMFTTFFSVARNNTSESLPEPMANLMVDVLNKWEDEDGSRKNLLLDVVLKALHRGKGGCELAKNVIKSCGDAVAPLIKELLKRNDLYETFYGIYCSAPSMISDIIPDLEKDFLDNDFKAEKLLAELIVTEQTKQIPDRLRDLFKEFLDPWSMEQSDYKTFSSEATELVLFGPLFSRRISDTNKVKNWVEVFSGFSECEIKAVKLEMDNKQSLRRCMETYLKVEVSQSDGSKVQDGLIKKMSSYFSDKTEAQKGFKDLDHKQWKALETYIYSSADCLFSKFWDDREKLLTILGKKDEVNNFLSVLSVKCSFFPFTKDYVDKLMAQMKQMGVKKKSCMDLLVMVGEFFPLVVSDCLPKLAELLKEDDKVIVVGVLRVLAKAGGSIKEVPDSLLTTLEDLCCKGDHVQAKHALQALEELRPDHKFKISTYQMLGSNLMCGHYLLATLQSLRRIAPQMKDWIQTRDTYKTISEIVKNYTEVAHANETFEDEPSEACLIKIYGVKTLVTLLKTLSPDNAPAQPEFEELVDILKSVLTVRKDSETVKSSIHMKFASSKAILRLSMNFEDKIPVELFHLAIRFCEDNPEARNLFLEKVHQYVKKRQLHTKYVCAFLFGIHDYKSPEWKNTKEYRIEVNRLYSNISYGVPGVILSYLVHALAHLTLCPEIDEQRVDATKFEPIYRQLHLFIFVALYGCGDNISDGGITEESFSKLYFTLKRITFSVDKFQKENSNYLHAICYLGMSIIEDLWSSNPDSELKSAKSLQLTNPALPEELYGERSEHKDYCPVLTAPDLKKLALKYREIDCRKFSDDPKQIEAGNRIKWWYFADDMFNEAEVICYSEDTGIIELKFVDDKESSKLILHNNIWRFIHLPEKQSMPDSARDRKERVRSPEDSRARKKLKKKSKKS